MIGALGLLPGSLDVGHIHELDFSVEEEWRQIQGIALGARGCPFCFHADCGKMSVDGDFELLADFFLGHHNYPLV